jgi:hypothetical protein
MAAYFGGNADQAIICVVSWNKRLTGLLRVLDGVREVLSDPTVASKLRRDARMP